MSEPTAPDDSSNDTATIDVQRAVARLADASEQETDPLPGVTDAVDHLEAALEAAPDASETAVRTDIAHRELVPVASATAAPDDTDTCIQNALAELAPVAAGVARPDRGVEDGHSVPDGPANRVEETGALDDVDLDLENAEIPSWEFEKVTRELDERPWTLYESIEVDPEMAERYRPVFEEIISDPDRVLHNFIHNTGRTTVGVTVDGMDAEDYFEEKSEGVSDSQIARAIMDALEAADEPLDWGELEAATGIDEDTLDAKLEVLQTEDIIRYSGRRGGWVLVGDSQA